MFKTISCNSNQKDIFVLNPINQFLIKKYPREEGQGFLGHYWDAYLFTLSLFGEDDGLNNVSVIITPEEYYNIPNPSISSCFDRWLDAFKKDDPSQSEYIILDSIPGTSKLLSIEFKGIPEDAKVALGEGLSRITKESIES